MKRETVLKTYQDSTTKVSELARHLAFAGIAVIWIFNKTVGSSFQIPNSLISPAILFIISLVLDICQYLYSGVAYYFLYRFGKITIEKNSDGEKVEKVNKPKWMNWPKWVLFGLKLVALFGGYILLLGYLKYLFVNQ